MLLALCTSEKNWLYEGRAENMYRFNHELAIVKITQSMTDNFIISKH